jgi:hypothetical protein
MNTLLETVLMLDLLLHFEFLAFVDEQTMQIVTRHSTIRWRYLRAWPVLHILGSLPTELSDLNEGGTPDLGSLRLLKLLLLVRMAFATPMTQSLNMRYRNQSHLQLSPTQSRLLGILCTSAFVIHLFVCSYWSLIRSRYHELEDGESLRRFLPSEEVWNNPGFLPRYTSALHTVVLLITQNDLQPKGEVEVMFCSALLLFGVLIVAIFIGSLTSIIEDADTLANKKQEQIQSVMSYMKYVIFFMCARTISLIAIRYPWLVIGTGTSRYHCSPRSYVISTTCGRAHSHHITRPLCTNCQTRWLCS